MFCFFFWTIRRFVRCSASEYLFQRIQRGEETKIKIENNNNELHTFSTQHTHQNHLHLLLFTYMYISISFSFFLYPCFCWCRCYCKDSISTIQYISIWIWLYNTICHIITMLCAPFPSTKSSSFDSIENLVFLFLFSIHTMLHMVQLVYSVRGYLCSNSLRI